jgi:dienelactone hydrolase
LRLADGGRQTPFPVTCENQNFPPFPGFNPNVIKKHSYSVMKNYHIFPSIIITLSLFTVDKAFSQPDGDIAPNLSKSPKGAGVQQLRFEPVDGKRSRTVPIKVYLCDQGDKKKPVVLFSHGLGGSRENSTYLGTHWAEAGYVVVFMQHPGSDESLWKDTPPKDRMKAMQEGASGKTFNDRMGDVPFVIDMLEKWNVEAGNPLNGQLDLEHIGMSGHSYGAVTTQALMGQKYGDRQLFHEPRLDAFLLMSPSPPATGTPQSAYGHIAAPIFCLTGTKDSTLIKTRAHVTPETRQSVFPGLKAGDKYHLVFKDGEHHIFSDSNRPGKQRDPRFHPAILELSTAFWDAYLKGDAKARDWLQSDQARKLLIDEDIYQWK